MITSDYHLHSNFSSDSESTPEEVIQKAISLGLKRICFTDHMDFDYPMDGTYNFSFVFNADDYFEKFRKLQETYQSSIEILIGVELGLQPYLKDKLNNFVNKYPFDFIIGSSHILDGIDPYYPQNWDGRNEEDIINLYFQSIINNTKVFQGFDVYGHIDYIVRYAPSQKRGELEYSYEKYKDILDEVLNTLIDKGIGLEINTAGLKYGLGFVHPHIDLLKKYKQLGGEILTIGSDAHTPAQLASGFSRAKEIAQESGFEYYTVFKNRKPEFIKF